MVCVTTLVLLVKIKPLFAHNVQLIHGEILTLRMEPVLALKAIMIMEELPVFNVTITVEHVKQHQICVALAQ